MSRYVGKTPSERGPISAATAGKVARTGTVVAVLIGLGFALHEQRWAEYAVVFGLLTVLDLFWIDIAPAFPIGLAYMGTLFAFVYIVGLPVLLVQVLVFPVSIRIMRVLERRGVVTPPWHIAALVRHGRQGWGPGREYLYLARFYGMLGNLGRFAAFRAVTHFAHLDFMAAVLVGEVGGYLTWALTMLVLPIPRVQGAPPVMTAEGARDLSLTTNLCMPALLAFILLGYRTYGIIGAAACALACLVFHPMIAELNHRRVRLEAANAELQETGVALRERSERLDEANQALEDKARALERKQEELRAFVYTVTHDLKNPLAAIILIADLIRERDGSGLTQDGRDDLDRLVHLAGGTEDMIRDLLNLFQITSASEEPAVVDLQALVAHALETLRPQILAKGVHVWVGAVPAVWGQTRKLGHAVTNLLSNAVKYVPAGRGEVTVRADVRDGRVRLCIGDNGIGIPAAYHQNIFELFGRVPPAEQVVDGRSVEGTGVGLAIVKRSVEACGGSVWVESEAGKGSRFYLELPLARVERAA